MRISRALTVALLLTGCATSGAESKVQSVMRKCGLTDEVKIEFKDERNLVITHVDPKTEFIRFDCFIAGIRPLNFEVSGIGYAAPAE